MKLKINFIKGIEHLILFSTLLKFREYELHWIGEYIGSRTDIHWLFGSSRFHLGFASSRINKHQHF